MISPIHIFTLVGGDTFGESRLLSFPVRFNRDNSESVSLSIPRTSTETCYVLSISVNDFFASRSHYLDSTEFTSSSAYSILSAKLPRDRTCEQIDYFVAYLTRHSSAKLFFSQFPPAILREICLHATLEKYATDEKLLVCIQEQGKFMSGFRVVLDGYIAKFKTHYRASRTADTKTAKVAEVDVPYKPAEQPNKGILRRFGGSTQHLQSNSNRFVEPVEVLCDDNAFGLLPVLLSSASSFGYVTYAATGSRRATTNILSFPASLTKLYLATIDESLICQPLRVLKQAVHTKRSAPCLQPSAPRKRQAMNDFERFILHCPTLFGIHRPKLRAMIDHMLVVNVPAHNFLFEAGEFTKGCIFIILEGNVRTYRCPVTDSKRVSRSSIRSKGGANVSSKLARVATKRNIPEEAPSTPEQAMFAFTKPVDDDFFAHGYKYVNELGMGDGFGRYGVLDVVHGSPQPSTSSHSSSKLNLLVRRATSRRFQTRQQSSLYTVYPETAITVSNCRLGILWSNSTVEGAFKLDPQRKAELIISMEAQANREANRHQLLIVEERNTSSSTLNTRCQIIERMGLAKRLQTRQLLKVAEALKFIEISGGDTSKCFSLRYSCDVEKFNSLSVQFAHAMKKDLRYTLFFPGVCVCKDFNGVTCFSFCKWVA